MIETILLNATRDDRGRTRFKESPA